MAFGFDQLLRLRNTVDYRYVFRRARKHVNTYLILFYIRNNLPHARLGVVVGKKAVKRSVDRNKVKRVVRESFRYHRHEITGFDIVIIGRKGVDTLSKQLLRQKVDRLWQQVR